MEEVMKITIEPKKIIKWSEKYGGKPQKIEVKDDSNMPGIRIDFPGKIDDIDLPKGKVTNISWDEFFDIFEKEKLAFMYIENINPKDPVCMLYAYRFIKRDELNMKTEDEIKELLDDLYNDFANRR